MRSKRKILRREQKGWGRVKSSSNGMILELVVVSLGVKVISYTLNYVAFTDCVM